MNGFWNLILSNTMFDGHCSLLICNPKVNLIFLVFPLYVSIRYVERSVFTPVKDRTWRQFFRDMWPAQILGAEILSMLSTLTSISILIYEAVMLVKTILDSDYNSRKKEILSYVVGCLLWGYLLVETVKRNKSLTASNVKSLQCQQKPDLRILSTLNKPMLHLLYYLDILVLFLNGLLLDLVIRSVCDMYKRGLRSLAFMPSFTRTLELIVLFLAILFLVKLLISRTHGPSSLWGSRLFSTKLKKSDIRIMWVCTCGDIMFGDFRGSSLNPLLALAAQLKGRVVSVPELLTRSSGISRGQLSYPSLPLSFNVLEIERESLELNQVSAVSPGQQTITRDSLSVQLSSSSDSSSMPKNQAKRKFGRAPASMQSNGSNITRTGASTAANLGNINRNPQWLELCIRSGSDTHILDEIDIAGSQTDQTVFEKIAKKYAMTRKALATSFWSVRVPSGGIFVQFRKDKLASSSDPATASVMKRNSVPNPQEAKTYRYSFFPLPMDEPPMPSQTFRHYLNKPHKADDAATWISRFPKLNDVSLYYGNEKLAKGWGIEITEARNWVLLLFMNLILLLVSGIVAGLYAHIAEDGATGIAIGAWMSAIQTLAANAMFFYWSDG